MPTSSAAINVRFLGVIYPKPYLNGENECFLEKNTHFQGLIDQNYRFGEARMTHHNFIKFGKKFWGKGSKLINFTDIFLEKL